MNSKTIPLKISVINTFNSIVDFVNEQEEIPREMSVIDTKLEIIYSKLKDIAELRLKENPNQQDPIIQHMINLGVINIFER